MPKLPARKTAMSIEIAKTAPSEALLVTFLQGSFSIMEI
jgi:hypothetical protein